MRTTTLVACLLVLCAASADAAITTIPWDIETTETAPKLLQLLRGELTYLDATYLKQGIPVDLLSVYEVELRYRSPDMATDSFYIAPGEVLDAAAGQIRVTWSPTNETSASVYQYTIVAKSAAGQIMRGLGSIRLVGTIQGDPATMPPQVFTEFDWALVDHINISSAPFIDASDLLAVNQANASQDVAIASVTALVGSGVAGVESNLAAHVAAQVVIDSNQDAAIADAAAGANMGGDVSGQSSNAVVVATRGRPFPTAADVPGNQEAIVWDSALNGGAGGYKHGSVDLSGIEADITSLQETKASRTEYAAWTNKITGMIDGNDHTLLYVETFTATNWLETLSDQWEHIENATWTLSDGSIAGGQASLYADYGELILVFTQCVSRVELDPDYDYVIQVGPDNDGPWTYYDVDRDNVVATNMFAVRLRNASGQQLTLNDVTVYTWTYPERVGATRDFAGLHLLADTPDGTIDREVLNLRYLWDYEPGGDLTGDLDAGLTVAKLQGTTINASGKANGYGMLYYSSVDQLRYADLATQAELDAAAALKADQAAHTALVARVTDTENGNVAMALDVIGKASNTTVRAIQHVAIDAPTVDQTSPMYDFATGTIVWRSILSSNVVYSTGTNEIANFPANAAGFYRAAFDGGYIMPLIVDQQLVGYVSTNGMTIPYGTLNILNSNLTSNVQAYDGNAAEPSYAFVGSPDLGWCRASSGGGYVWRFVSGGNVIADLGIDGLQMADGKTIAGYATTGTVSGIDTRLISVEAWPTGQWASAYSWGDHAAAGYSSSNHTHQYVDGGNFGVMDYTPTAPSQGPLPRYLLDVRAQDAETVISAQSRNDWYPATVRLAISGAEQTNAFQITVGRATGTEANRLCYTDFRFQNHTFMHVYTNGMITLPKTIPNANVGTIGLRIEGDLSIGFEGGDAKIVTTSDAEGNEGITEWYHDDSNGTTIDTIGNPTLDLLRLKNDGVLKFRVNSDGLIENTKTITNSIVDASGVTNTMVFTGGLLTSLKHNGVEQ